MGDTPPEGIPTAPPLVLPHLLVVQVVIQGATAFMNVNLPPGAGIDPGVRIPSEERFDVLIEDSLDTSPLQRMVRSQTLRQLK